jgi:hypothetical protein
MRYSRFLLGDIDFGSAEVDSVECLVEELAVRNIAVEEDVETALVCGHADSDV